MNRLNNKVVALLLGASLLTACGEDPRTQITVYIERDTADVAFSSSISTVRVEFFETDGTMLTTQDFTSPVAFPVTLAVVPAMTDEFVVHVTAFDGSSMAIADAVTRTSFASGRTKMVYLLLSRSTCTGAQITGCEFDERCGTLGCRDVPEVDPADLLDGPRPDTAPTPPSCTGVTCGMNETCTTDPGAAICVCNASATGTPATGCTDLCSELGAPNCGANGTCVADTGVAQCSCDFPFAGTTCDTCGPGWADDGMGGCEAACLGACSGAFSFCDDTLLEPACVCPIGYEFVSTDCVWQGGGTNGGGFPDQELEDASMWTEVSFPITETGGGSATGSNGGICGESTLSATIDMPTRAESQAFVVEITTTSNDPSGFECNAQPMLRVGDAIQRFNFTGSSLFTGRACLPPGGYGRASTISLVADPYEHGSISSNSNSCVDSGGSTCIPVTVDSVSIVRANPGECPDSGILNGTFDDASEWQMNASLNSNPGTSNISGGTMNLGLTKHGQRVWGQQTVRFPTADQMPNPALRMTTDISNEHWLRVGILDGFERFPLVQPAGAPGSEMVTYCIPSWLQGTVHDLYIELSTSAGGLFSVDAVQSATVDDVAFESNATCANLPPVPNAGFEGGVGNNVFVANVPSLSTGRTDPFVFTPTMSTPASGSWALVFDDNGHGSARAEALVQIPLDPTGANGPMVRFSYRVTNTSQTPSLRVVPTPGMTPTSVTPTTVYQQFDVCLDRDVAGQVIPLEFLFTRSGSGNVVHLIDDIELVLDSGC